MSVGKNYLPSGIDFNWGRELNSKETESGWLSAALKGFCPSALISITFNHANMKGSLRSKWFANVSISWKFASVYYWLKFSIQAYASLDSNFEWLNDFAIWRRALLNDEDESPHVIVLLCHFIAQKSSGTEGGAVSGRRRQRRPSHVNPQRNDWEGTRWQQSRHFYQSLVVGEWERKKDENPQIISIRAHKINKAQSRERAKADGQTMTSIAASNYLDIEAPNNSKQSSFCGSLLAEWEKSIFLSPSFARLLATKLSFLLSCRKKFVLSSLGKSLYRQSRANYCRKANEKRREQKVFN